MKRRSKVLHPKLAYDHIPSTGRRQDEMAAGFRVLATWLLRFHKQQKANGNSQMESAVTLGK